MCSHISCREGLGEWRKQSERASASQSLPRTGAILLPNGAARARAFPAAGRTPVISIGSEESSGGCELELAFFCFVLSLFFFFKVLSAILIGTGSCYSL